MRLLLITTLLFASGMSGASASERRLDKSKEFAYTLPDGWNVVPTLNRAHDVIALGDDKRRRAGDLFVEIHPQDARPRRVATGDAVRVWNHRGEVHAVCSVTDRVRPGVVSMPFGGVVDAGGARRSVNVLTPEEPTDWGGGSGLYDAFVEVAPATRG